MPSGKVHIRYWKYVLPFSCIVSVILMFYSFLSGMMFLLGYLLGYICDPDLDKLGITSAEGRALHKFGIFGLLWIMYWMPYAFLTKHRGISHVPILGTAIRFLYLLIIPMALVLYYTIPLSDQVLWMAGWCFVGLVMSDLVHIFLDYRR